MIQTVLGLILNPLVALTPGRGCLAAAAERDYGSFFRRHFWQARSSDSEGEEEAGEPHGGDQPQQQHQPQQQQEQPAGAGGSGEPGSNRSPKSGKGAG